MAENMVDVRGLDEARSGLGRQDLTPAQLRELAGAVASWALQEARRHDPDAHASEISGPHRWARLVDEFMAATSPELEAKCLFKLVAEAARKAQQSWDTEQMMTGRSPRYFYWSMLQDVWQLVELVAVQYGQLTVWRTEPEDVHTEAVLLQGYLDSLRAAFKRAAVARKALEDWRRGR